MRRLLVSTALAIAHPIHAECTYPKAPRTIPNAKTASQSDMVTAMQAFKAYSEEVKNYGACLDQEVSTKADSISAS